MSPRRNIYNKLDWVLIICYLLLVVIGWFNIYASIYNEELGNIFSLSHRSGSQLVWMGISAVAAILILFVINPKIYIGLAWWFYLLIILLLVLVLIFGKEVAGSKSWIQLGPFGFQPSELSKITTSLCLAALMSKYGFKLTSGSSVMKVIVTILIPSFLILLEPEWGTVLVYCGFLFVLYREGLSGWFLLFIGLIILLFIFTLKFSPFVSILVLIGIIGLSKGIISKVISSSILYFGIGITALSFLPRLLKQDFMYHFTYVKTEYWLLILTAPFVIGYLIKGIRDGLKYYKNIVLCFVCSIALIFSVEFIFNNVLQNHHQSRIESLLGITEDLQGSGYNVNQSKIAIGSGGLTGKGFLQGTQTKFRFVPEQSTDFIFCTVGEEWGFLGSLAVLILYFILITRIISLAERQNDSLVRIYGYCVAACFFMHVLINIGMTIGLMPVVGIPLPFISYGGTSLVSFTTLLFIFIRLDIEKWR